MSKAHTEMPVMTAASLTYSGYRTNDNTSEGGWTNDGYGYVHAVPAHYDNAWPDKETENQEFLRRIAMTKFPNQLTTTSKTKEKKMAKVSFRVVRVFVVDPDTKVPLEERVLHKTEEITTDLSDQDLFFEIDPPVKQLLDRHNKEVREKIVNKDVKDRTEYLEPIKISNLSMVVVTLASFSE